jgi:hypothetical protein
MTTLVAPSADPVAEGARIAELAHEAGLDLRLVGGVGVALRCPSAASASLRRAYKDVDVAGRSVDRARIGRLLVESGYVADEQFNALNGARRLLYYDTANGRQLDVFLDRVELCHNIDLLPRLGITGATLPPADLLLMKLQVVETNDKDFRDMAAMLADLPLASHDDDDAINVDYLCGLAARDWGLWRTMTMVAGKLDAHAPTFGDASIAAAVTDKVAALLAALDSIPKSRGWRLRSRVGDRVRWYELPDDGG